MPRWLPALLLILVVAVVLAAIDLRSAKHPPRERDAHWVGGIFYVNRADARILVPKRYGLGFGRTLNLAHPVSWLVLGAPLVIAVIGATR